MKRWLPVGVLLQRMVWLCWVMLAFVSGLAAQESGPPADELTKAVDRALDYLKTMQDRDGAWTGYGSRDPAMTSLGVMAFLSAGHVPGEGPYAEVVDKGIRYVLSTQLPDGSFGQHSGLGMYHQGICTLMLAEVAGMTDAETGKKVREGVVKGVKLILEAQRKEGPFKGGWRYQVFGTDADLSITGWQVLALRAARNIGCDIPGERIDWALDFVLQCRNPQNGAFRYQPGGRETAACTGTGILCLELAGKGKHRCREALEGGTWILKNPPVWGQEHFSYTNYYTAQAMFQLGGNYWQVHRGRLHKLLLNQQKRNGGWLPSDQYFGPAYATSLAVLALTVEYRFLPIYQRGAKE